MDYGRKRTGVAVTDTLQIIAGGLQTVETGKLIPFLRDYFAKEDVSKVIIGLPKTVKGEEKGDLTFDITIWHELYPPFHGPVPKDVPGYPD